MQRDEGVDESIDERIGNDRIAERVYVREDLGSCLVGRLRKRWIGSTTDCFYKEVSVLRKQGEWCMIEMNCRGL